MHINSGILNHAFYRAAIATGGKTWHVLGKIWYVALTERLKPQVDAGIELTLDICRRHDIEPSFYYPSTTFDSPRCFQVATIVCHSNCRKDKTDLALPDWVYERVEEAGIRLVS